MLKTVILNFILLLNATLLFSQDVPAVFKNTHENIFAIVTLDKNDSALIQGTGFFVSKGYAVSNLHVFKNAQKAIVKTFNGNLFTVDSIIASDSASDIIIFSVNCGKYSGIPVELNPPGNGDKIIVIGNPFGLEQTVSDGIVSSVRELQDFGPIIQITAPISVGSSGSPVLNAKSKVVGIATSYIANGQNLNFAVPIIRAIKLFPHAFIFDRPNASDISSFKEKTIDFLESRLHYNKLPFSIHIGSFDISYNINKHSTYLKGNLIECFKKRSLFEITNNIIDKDSLRPNLTINMSISKFNNKFNMSFQVVNNATGIVDIIINDAIDCSLNRLLDIYWNKFCLICRNEVSKYYGYKSLSSYESYYRTIYNLIQTKEYVDFDLMELMKNQEFLLTVADELNSIRFFSDKDHFKKACWMQDMDVYNNVQATSLNKVQCGSSNIASVGKISKELYDLLLLTHGKSIDRNTLNSIMVKLNQLSECTLQIHSLLISWEYADWIKNDKKRSNRYYINSF